MSKEPKNPEESDTIPVKKNCTLTPDATCRRGRRNWVKLGDLNLMNSTKNRFANTKVAQNASEQGCSLS